jgi:hypothetical protein
MVFSSPAASARHPIPDQLLARDAQVVEQPAGDCAKARCWHLATKPASSANCFAARSPKLALFHSVSQLAAKAENAASASFKCSDRAKSGGPPPTDVNESICVKKETRVHSETFPLAAGDPVDPLVGSRLANGLESRTPAPVLCPFSRKMILSPHRIPTSFSRNSFGNRTANFRNEKPEPSLFESLWIYTLTIYAEEQ